MIVYPQGTAIYQTLYRIHGSALYKGLLPALLSTGFLLLLKFTIDEPNALVDERWFIHPYPIAAMLAAFTFLLTFKCSFSYNRVSDGTYYTLFCIQAHKTNIVID
jgi:hypothetical protein